MNNSRLITAKQCVYGVNCNNVGKGTYQIGFPAYQCLTCHNIVCTRCSDKEPIKSPSCTSCEVCKQPKNIFHNWNTIMEING